MGTISLIVFRKQSRLVKLKQRVTVMSCFNPNRSLGLKKTQEWSVSFMPPETTAHLAGYL